MATFELKNYLPEMREISKNSGCTLTAAVDRMIENLRTFREYHRGTGTLNYHVLSNQWGTLSCTEQNAQKLEAKKLIIEPEPEPDITPRRRRRV